MHLVVLAVSTAVILSHSATIAAIWGVIASVIAEVAKQDGLSQKVNTLIADTVVIITALVLSLTHIPAGSSISWAGLGSYLWYAAVAAAVAHGIVLKPSGIGAKIQTLTTLPSLKKAA